LHAAAVTMIIAAAMIMAPAEAARLLEGFRVIRKLI
jgi:hypothetical protein